MFFFPPFILSGRVRCSNNVVYKCAHRDCTCSVQSASTDRPSGDVATGLALFPYYNRSAALELFSSCSCSRCWHRLGSVVGQQFFSNLDEPDAAVVTTYRPVLCWLRRLCQTWVSGWNCVIFFLSFKDEVLVVMLMYAGQKMLKYTLMFRVLGFAGGRNCRDTPSLLP